MKRWSTKLENTLRRYHAEGYSASDAAKAMGRGVEGVRSKARMLGLTFPLARAGRVAVAPIEERHNFIAPPVRRYSSFTQFVLGDPPDGRSALDQKRAGA
jgi:hypothetical protein